MKEKKKDCIGGEINRTKIKKGRVKGWRDAQKLRKGRNGQEK